MVITPPQGGYNPHSSNTNTTLAENKHALWTREALLDLETRRRALPETLMLSSFPMETDASGQQQGTSEPIWTSKKYAKLNMRSRYQGGSDRGRTSKTPIPRMRSRDSASKPLSEVIRQNRIDWNKIKKLTPQEWEEIKGQSSHGQSNKRIEFPKKR